MRTLVAAAGDHGHEWIDTQSTLAVMRRVDQAYRSMYPVGNKRFVSWAFELAKGCFDGQFPGFLPIDAHYHDWEHTLQGTLAFAILLEGRFQAAAEPILDQEMGELGILAILLHDTGYLKRSDDIFGTGAKYTATHVHRSCEFAEVLLSRHGYSHPEIRSVQHMIRCTGVGFKINAVPFQSDAEKVAGFALGTADLVGQMAAPDYIAKLPVLFDEFQESARFNEGRDGTISAFGSAEELRQKTPSFWEKYVRPRIEGEFSGLYRYLSRPAPNGYNPYIEAIETNIRKLELQLAGLGEDSTGGSAAPKLRGLAHENALAAHRY